MSVEWSYYKKFNPILSKYMESYGEGDNLASQAVTAVNRLVYKWYNDGDVYDNTRYLEGWANDLSSEANWLYTYLESSAMRSILESVWECSNDDEYEALLKRLADFVLDEGRLAIYTEVPKEGSIYTCKGPFEFLEDKYADDEDEYWDEDEDDDDYI